MSKHKFKVGDLVVLKDNIKAGDYINGVTIIRSMYRDLKNPCRIKHIYENNAAYIDRWIFPLCVLKPFYPEKIIIYRNGSEVIAKNTATGKTGVAKCNPTDEFDFETGAKLAFGRLTSPEPKKPKYYNGKVVCIDGRGLANTKGKIYKVLDGRLEFDGGQKSADRFESVDQINDTFVSKFIEIVE